MCPMTACAGLLGLLAGLPLLGSLFARFRAFHAFGAGRPSAAPAETDECLDQPGLLEARCEAAAPRERLITA